MLGALCGRRDLELTIYGLTTRGWPTLKRSLPPGARLCRGPMPAGALVRIWSRSDLAPAEWWTGRADVVHGTNFVVPPARRAARLVTVYDLTPVLYPELCTRSSRRYAALMRRAVERGAWVHTPSQSVAADVVELLGARAERVRCVPLGLRQDADAPAGNDGAAPTDRASPHPPYIFALGTAEPRKDFPNLVAAFDLLAGSHPDLELRIAGGPGWGEEALQRAVERAVHRDRVRRLGWVDEREARQLLAEAVVFAYPSLYEGFGYPPLEAMSAGTPVVATTAGSLPEVLGDAALLVEPADPAALAGALAQAIEDTELRARLKEAGRRRAATYTWETCAEGLARLYWDAACE
jgi:glycosyltransferase involved in cell wall biosynthesis